MAKKHNVCESGFTVTIYVGYKLNLPWEYQNPDGTGIDLTGKNVVFKLIFENVTYVYTEVANSYGSVITMTDEVNGKFTLQITAAETATLEEVTGVWVLVIDDEIIYTDIAIITKL